MFASRWSFTENHSSSTVANKSTLHNAQKNTSLNKPLHVKTARAINWNTHVHRR